MGKRRGRRAPSCARPSFFAVALAAAATLQSESGCKDCFDQFELGLNEDLHGAEGLACDLTLTNGDMTAHYTVQPILLPDGGPTPEGGSCSEEEGLVPCATLAGPQLPRPLGCFRSRCSLTVSASGPDAQGVSNFLGSTSFDVTVTCGGVVLHRERGVISTRGCNG